MKTVKIQILAEDIRNTDYTISRDCAITRALQRAGINARDTGYGKIYYGRVPGTGSLIGALKTEDNSKVLSMYAFCSSRPERFSSGEMDIIPLEPEDFEIEVNLDI